MTELTSEERSKMLDIMREGFTAQKYVGYCPYLCGTIENEYWWKGFQLAADISRAILLEK